MAWAPGWSLIVFAVVLPTLLLAMGFLIAAIQRAPSEPPRTDPISGPGQVLAERLARGEIDTEEYEQRMHVLHAARR